MRSHIEKTAQPMWVIELDAHTRVAVVAGRNSQRGFTLVELITVMVIVGILAVSVLPRFFTVSDFENRGSADQVKSLLRFAQKTAIAQHRNISVVISGGVASPNCTTTLAGASPELTCQVKSTVTAGAGTYTFNALGQPTAGTACITVSGSNALKVEAETGYVHSVAVCP